jgi:hypothetical protein
MLVEQDSVQEMVPILEPEVVHNRLLQHSMPAVQNEKDKYYK